MRQWPLVHRDLPAGTRDERQHLCVPSRDAAAFPNEQRRQEGHRGQLCLLDWNSVRGAGLVLCSGRWRDRKRPAPAAFARESRDSDTWIGRCFMEHPRDYALTLHPRTPDLFRQATFFDVHTARAALSLWDGLRWMIRLCGDSICRMLQSHFCLVRRLRRRVYRLPESRGMCVALSSRSRKSAATAGPGTQTWRTPVTPFNSSSTSSSGPIPKTGCSSHERGTHSDRRESTCSGAGARANRRISRGSGWLSPQHWKTAALVGWRSTRGSGLIRTRTIIRAPRECTPILVGVSLMLTAVFMEPITCS